MAPILADVGKRVRAVVARIAAGDNAGAAEQFVETMAFGPGTWTTLPPDLRQTFIENASTYLDEANDPEQITFDLD
jgi:histone acetyltransferase (RNA polymerase elongator complex component)